ncbi:protein REVEILLE 6 [Dorcoceras hygrometricum]|uniref:Protein REVEILLE 6 n=1 Tax=Dorcoceras hygrometricum TaxID=472368 RepID=A0A2Z7BWN4_9LAMI|nr:protein REVEILLE 6 [Dorcoceras hygrometricum]
MASSTTLPQEEPNRKVRKQYTISKTRESWTEPEHDKFMEAIQLFDRDWKKIEAFIGSKSVIQIRSHAQKYFLKIQKSGIKEHLPPPRPKRKAAHPYPQKASKIAVGLRPISSLQASHVVPDTGSVSRPDSLASLRHSDSAPSLPSLIKNSVKKGDVQSGGQSVPGIYCYCGNDNSPRARSTVLPDFAQVYRFIGSVFDPSVTGHLQKLKKMDQIDIETVLLLMRNLSVNLSGPDFEDHRRLLSAYEVDQTDNAYNTAKYIRDQFGESA